MSYKKGTTVSLKGYIEAVVPTKEGTELYNIRLKDESIITCRREAIDEEDNTASSIYPEKPDTSGFDFVPVKAQSSYGGYREDVKLKRILPSEFDKNYHDPMPYTNEDGSHPDNEVLLQVVCGDDARVAGYTAYLTYTDAMLITVLYIEPVGSGVSEIREGVLHDLLYKAEMTDRKVYYLRKKPG